MLAWNLGLEIVAIHPNSGGILGRPMEMTAERSEDLSSPGLTRHPSSLENASYRD
jgi:hypothetical protein